jgi:hypothetical protein
MASQAPIVVSYKPIDLATVPEPIGTMKAPSRDLTGMPLVQPSGGGLPFDGFSFAYSTGAIPAVSSLGYENLQAAAEAQLPPVKGTLRQVLAGTVLPAVREWAQDAVMVAAIGVVDNAGIGPVPQTLPGVSVPALGWIAAFQSVQRNEALLFSVDETQTRVLKLTFAAKLQPIKPGVSGATVDSDALLATVRTGMSDLSYAAPDSPFVYSPPNYPLEIGALMVTLTRQQAAYAQQMATRGDMPEPDTGTYADSRWWIFLHRETTDNANSGLVWYVQLHPGPSSHGTGGLISELFGGVAKVDATNGNRLMLMHPWRSNPKGYRAGPQPSRTPGPPPTAIPTPTAPPPGFAPSPPPTTFPSPTPIP